MSGEGKKQIVIGCLILLVSCVIIIYYLTSSWHLCYPTTEKPEIEPTKLPIIFDEDLRVFIRFGGYLVIEKPSPNQPPLDNKKVTSYLELQAIERLTVTTYTNTKYPILETSLDVNTVCGKTSILMAKVDDILQCRNMHIDMGQMGSCKIECSSIAARLGKHYVCYKDRVFPCLAMNDTQKISAKEFHMQALEFEIDGDKQDYRNGHFSTQSSYCNDN